MEEKQLPLFTSAWKELQFTHCSVTGNRGLVHTAPAGPQLFSPSPIAHCPSLQGDNSHGPQRSSNPLASSVASQSLPHLIPAHSFSWKVTVSGYTVHIVAFVLKASSHFLSRCTENRPSVRLAAAHSSLHEGARCFSPYPFEWPVGRTAWLSDWFSQRTNTETDQMKARDLKHR